MKKPTPIILGWIIVAGLPIPLAISCIFLGLIGVAGLVYYYSPLWFLGEPYFELITDIGLLFPTWLGAGVAVVAYSLVYWAIAIPTNLMIKKIKKKKNEKPEENI